MNRTLLYLICLAVCCPVVSLAGQDSLVQHRHMFSVSYGTLSADNHLVGYHVSRTSSPDFINKGIPGTLCLGYQYRVNRTFSIGMSTAMEQQHGDWLNGRNGYSTTQVIGAFVRSSLTVAADFTCNYVTRDMFRIYITAGIGSTLGHATRQYNSTYYTMGYQDGVNTYGPMRIDEWGQHMNGYLAPLGISVGRALSYFVEAGYGYKGAINTGLTYSIK